MSTLQSQGSNSSRFEALADEVRQSPDAQHEEITSQSEHLSEKSVALQPKGIEVESSPPPDGGAAAWSVVVGGESQRNLGSSIPLSPLPFWI